jgi:hypothetical protein
MPEPIPNLIPLVLINGAISAAVAVIVPAFLLSRFTRDIIGVPYWSSSCLLDLTRSGGHLRVWRQSLRGGGPHAEEDRISLPRGVQG